MSHLKHYQINPVVSCGEEADGAILFHPETDNTAAINDTGLTLWLFLQTPRTIADMIAFLTDQFQDVSTTQATADVTRFIETLAPDFLFETDTEKS